MAIGADIFSWPFNFDHDNILARASLRVGTTSETSVLILQALLYGQHSSRICRSNSVVGDRSSQP
jgi:hypothetical protein